MAIKPKIKKKNKELGMQKEIVKYLKNKKGQKVGCLIGLKDEKNVVRVGWSAFASSREHNEFSREKGLEIARGRATNPRLDKPITVSKLPFSVQNEMEKFLDRCDRYFK